MFTYSNVDDLLSTVPLRGSQKCYDVFLLTLIFHDDVIGS